MLKTPTSVWYLHSSVKKNRYKGKKYPAVGRFFRSNTSFSDDIIYTSSSPQRIPETKLEFQRGPGKTTNTVQKWWGIIDSGRRRRRLGAAEIGKPSEGLEIQVERDGVRSCFDYSPTPTVKNHGASLTKVSPNRGTVEGPQSEKGSSVIQRRMGPHGSDPPSLSLFLLAVPLPFPSSSASFSFPFRGTFTCYFFAPFLFILCPQKLRSTI